MAIMDAVFRRQQSTIADPSSPPTEPALDVDQLAAALADAYRRKPSLDAARARPANDTPDLPPDTADEPAPRAFAAEQPAADTVAPSPVSEVEPAAPAHDVTQPARADQLAWLQRARRRRLREGFEHAGSWLLTVFVACGIAGLVALAVYGLPASIASRFGLMPSASVSSTPSANLPR